MRKEKEVHAKLKEIQKIGLMIEDKLHKSNLSFEKKHYQNQARLFEALKSTLTWVLHEDVDWIIFDEKAMSSM